jgi:hypothetical protein
MKINGVKQRISRLSALFKKQILKVNCQAGFSNMKLIAKDQGNCLGGKSYFFLM